PDQGDGHARPVGDPPRLGRGDRVERPAAGLGARRAGREEHGEQRRAPGQRPQRPAARGRPRGPPARRRGQHSFPLVQRGTSGGSPSARATRPAIVSAKGSISLCTGSSWATSARVLPSAYPTAENTMYGPVATHPVRCRWSAPNRSATVPGKATGRTPARPSARSSAVALARASSLSITATPTVTAKVALWSTYVARSR